MLSAAALARPVARLYSRFDAASAGSILCLHSFAAESPGGGSAHVPASMLRMAVDIARDVGTIVTLRELLERRRRQQSTRGLVALTFDDAYVALLGADAAFLREEGIPFTIFVTTDAARDGKAFWWDRVEELYPRASRERWLAFERDCKLPDAFRDRQPAEFGPLRPLRQWMLYAYEGRMPPHVNRALLALESELGHRTEQRSMTFAELTPLMSSGSVDVGVHTCSHPVLPLLPDEELRREIGGCYAILREIFPRTLPVLAAPFGLFDDRSVRCAREEGMQVTLTLGGRTMSTETSEDWLPRFCLSAGERDWKLLLRVTGVVERWRDWRGQSESPYPELPSAST